jgi:ectoine hydroxylase-related dioxygenase (phytanoyl-CoA dioxygenase family)
MGVQLTNQLIQAGSVAEVRERIDEIRDRADRGGFAIVRGAVDKDVVESLRERIRRLFDPRADVRISGHYQRGWKDFQRLDLGEYVASSRFARYFFFFPWNRDPEVERVAADQIDIFNRLARKSAAFGSQTPADSDPDRFRMSYAIQYPTGGGFMSRHREWTQREEGDKAYALYLALTTRGEDFDSGGAWVEIDGRKVDIEAHAQAGDLVLYRGDLYHGVSGIDRHKPVSLDRLCGRIMFTTTIKYFER